VSSSFSKRMRPSCCGDPRASLELLDPVRQAGGDLPHPVRVDADACVLHRAEDHAQRKLDVAVEALGAAIGDLRGERPHEAACRLGVPH